MPTDTPLQALREANPRQQPGFAAEVERYHSLRQQIASSPIPLARPAARRRDHRRVIGTSAAAAAALAAAALVVALTLSAAGPSSAYAAAKKALAATTAATSGTMTTMVTHNGQEAYTLATTEWNGSDIALIGGTRGDLGSIQQLLLVGGSVYVQQDGSWVRYATPSDVDPMLSSMLQLARNNVAGNTSEEILRLATGLEQTTQPDGSTIYTGTIPNSTATRVGAPTDDTIMQIINSLRIGPTTPGTPGGFHNGLQLRMTVGSDGFVRQVSLTYQQQNTRSTSGDGTYTESVTYSRLGSTAPITAPASPTPASAATTPATATTGSKTTTTAP